MVWEDLGRVFSVSVVRKWTSLSASFSHRLSKYACVLLWRRSEPWARSDTHKNETDPCMNWSIIDLGSRSTATTAAVQKKTSCNQIADDTALTTVSSSPTECEGHLQRSVDATSTWLSEWKLAVNVDKTVSMEFTRRSFSSDFAINLNGNTLEKVRMQRHDLGLVLTSDLRWTAHVNQVLSKAARLLHTLKRLRCTLSKAALTL